MREQSLNTSAFCTLKCTLKVFLALGAYNLEPQPQAFGRCLGVLKALLSETLLSACWTYFR